MDKESGGGSAAAQTIQEDQPLTKALGTGRARPETVACVMFLDIT